MLQITNGTVSRTVKVADYEGRTVTLSFTTDPGDDIDTGLATISALAEKYARAAPGVVAKKNPVQEAKPVPPTTEAVTAVSDIPTAEPQDASSVVITDADLTKACQTATQRMNDPMPVKKLIADFVGAIGARVNMVAPEKRAALLTKLNALKPGTAPASDDY